MRLHEICVLYAVNNTQYKKLKRIEKRAAKLTGHKMPCGYLLSAFFQPGAQDQIDQALSTMEKALDEAEIAAYDPFNDPKWPEG